MGSDVFMPMPVLTVADGEFANDVEGRLGGASWSMAASQFVTAG